MESLPKGVMTTVICRSVTGRSYTRWQRDVSRDVYVSTKNALCAKLVVANYTLCQQGDRVVKTAMLQATLIGASGQNLTHSLILSEWDRRLDNFSGASGKTAKSPGKISSKNDAHYANQQLSTIDK